MREFDPYMDRNSNGLDSMDFALIRHACRTTFIALAMLLAACAIKPLTTDATLKPDEGAFVVKITFDPELQTSLAWEIDRLKLKSVDVPDTRTFVGPSGQQDSTSPASMTFSGALKPGRYELAWATGLNGNVEVPLTTFGHFDVRAGHVSMLGTLIVRPVNEQRSALLVKVRYGYAPPDEAAVAAMKNYFPSLSKQVQERIVRGFVYPPSVSETTAAIKSSSRFVASVWQDEEGNVFVARSMGQVALKQTTQQTWREIDVGSWRGVSSFRPYRSGHLIGGDEGLFRFTSDLGKTWSDVALPLWGEVVHIEVLRSNRVVVVVRRGDEWTALVADDALLGPWKTLAVLAMPGSKAIRYFQVLPSFALQGDTLLILGRDQKLQRLSLLDGTINTISLPRPMAFVNAQTHGALVLRSLGTSPAALVSRDGGGTWHEMRKRGFLVFKDQTTVFSVNDMDVAVSRDGGERWVNHERAPWQEYAVREVLISRADKSLLVFLHDGSIYRSLNDGATWQRER